MGDNQQPTTTTEPTDEEFFVSIGDEEVPITPETTVGEVREMPYVDADPDDVLTVASGDGRLKALGEDSSLIAKHAEPGARLAFHPPFDKTVVGTRLATGGMR